MVTPRFSRSKLALWQLSLAVSLGAASFAQAQTLPEGTEKIVDFCAACHGKDGISHLESIPNLYGQSEEYLATQIRLMRDQKRNTQFMKAFISQISDEQIKTVSSYYASLPVDNDEIKLQWRGEKWPGDMSLGEKIAYTGKPEADVPGCVVCHGPNGVGVKPVIPRLAGQNPQYLTNQMIAWQNDERPQDALNIMPPIAKALSAEEIQAVATYFSEQGNIQQRVKADEAAVEKRIDAEMKAMEDAKAAAENVNTSKESN